MYSLLESFERMYRLIDDDRAKIQAAVLGEALNNHDMKEITPEFVEEVFQGRVEALNYFERKLI